MELAEIDNIELHQAKTRVKIPIMHIANSLPSPPTHSFHLKRTLYFRHTADLYQNNFNSENDQPIIPKLKCLLKQLESPEKKNKEKKWSKAEKTECLENLLRKNESVVVENLIESRRNSVRIKKVVSEKKQRISYNNFMDQPTSLNSQSMKKDKAIIYAQVNQIR
jgi:hypothetical protein